MAKYLSPKYEDYFCLENPIYFLFYLQYYLYLGFI